MSGKHTSHESNEPDSTPVATTGDALPSVEEQRAEVAETVAALAAKTDVAARVHNEAAYQTDRAKAVAEQNPQMVAAVVGGVIAAFVVTVILRRRRRSRRFVV